MRRATEREKASGVPVNLLIPIAFAGVGALVSKNKVKGGDFGIGNTFRRYRRNGAFKRRDCEGRNFKITENER